MGILNVTPDSFSDGGQYLDGDKAVEQAHQMIAEGADIIDIGGESTRPGADVVSAQEEIERIIPVIENLRGEALVSVDTSKAEVAREALRAGAQIVNDVSGLRDLEMREVCAASTCGIVAMHMQGKPQTMQENPAYDDVVGEVRAFFEQCLADLGSLGIEKKRICLDPGSDSGKIWSIIGYF
nr:dihydropteroate synthase-like [Nerophis lumbriciformis]